MEVTPHREFELLVTRIEAALAPIGARVKSPDYVLDNFTGEQREVDASIRYTVGSAQLLIAVECRDRVKTEDVTWIEQLATREKHIGAAHTIAVSSTGFSAPALKAAKLHGISTRTIQEVSDPDILAWVDTLEVDEINTACVLGRMVLEYHGTYPGAHIDAPSEQQWRDHGWDAAIFVDRAADHKLSLSDLLRSAARDQGHPLQDTGDAVSLTIPPRTSMSFSRDPHVLLAREAPEDGSTIQKAFWLEVVDEELAVGTNYGLLNVRRVGFEVTMSSKRQRVPVARIVRYSGDQRSIADVAERELVDEKGARLVMTQYRAIDET